MEREDRFTFGLTVTAIALVTVLMIVESPGPGGMSEREGKHVARGFVKSSPTYSFDGHDLKYKEILDSDTAKCESCYTYVFKFKSRHPGYGNRSGEMLAQVITPHEARVTVESGEVISANLDGKWNMIDQEHLQEKEPGKETGFCGWSTGGSCSSDADCIAAGCSGQVCDSTGGKQVVTTCEWKECYSASKYGLECKCVRGECQWSK